MEVKLSTLGHTWIMDLDGTIVKHNGYQLDGCDTLLDGVKEFMQSLSADDMIVFVTSRTPEYKNVTENFLISHGIRYDHIIFNAPYGERILINDRKPSGLNTALAVNVERDRQFDMTIKVDEAL